MSRVRKAYHIRLKSYDQGDIVYAPTAAKAKAALYYLIETMTFGEIMRDIKSCRRAPERDMVLPDRHPLANQISDEILHCVTHAYGGTGIEAGYRDHFYTSDKDAVMKAAYYHGLFDRYRVDKRMAGRSDMVMYELTTLGKNVARGEAETYPRGR